MLRARNKRDIIIALLHGKTTIGDTTSLRNIVGPEPIRIAAEHLGYTGVSLSQIPPKVFSITLIEQSRADCPILPSADIPTPYRHETDQNPVLYCSSSNPVNKAEIILIWLRRVIVVNRQVTVEVGNGGHVVLGQEHILVNSEALGSSIGEIQVRIRFFEPLEELPVCICYPGEWVAGGSTIEISSIPVEGGWVAEIARSAHGRVSRDGVSSGPEKAEMTRHGLPIRKDRRGIVLQVIRGGLHSSGLCPI